MGNICLILQIKKACLTLLVVTVLSHAAYVNPRLLKGNVLIILNERGVSCCMVNCPSHTVDGKCLSHSADANSLFHVADANVCLMREMFVSGC